MKNKRMLRILTLVVVLSMIFTTAAFAAPGKKGFGYYKGYKPYSYDYEDALNCLIKKEIVKGYGNGDYGLSGNVKRGDIVVMIIRMLDEYGIIDSDDLEDELSSSYLKVFEDVEPKQYYYGSIKIAIKLGIAKGDGLYFRPDRHVTIQETIWLIQRAAELLDIDFEPDKIDDLEEIYKDELNDYAKRRDVFWMLYYVFDLNISVDKDVDEFADIKLDMKDDSLLDFKDKWFTKAYDAAVTDKNKDDLEYVKFSLPKNGKLYYDYDEDKRENALVTEKAKYYLGDDEKNVIEDITFVPDRNFKGTATIGYTAYTEDKSYSGLIKIAVDRNDALEDLSYKVSENESVYFDEDDFPSFIDGAKFEIPDMKTGTLYYDQDEDGNAEWNEVINVWNVYDRDELDYVIFVPYQDFKGEAVVKYTGYDYSNDGTYYGKIKITVKDAQEIPTLKLNADLDDEEIKIDFVDKLNDLIDDDIVDIDALDYVKFELPETGTLKIKLENKNSVMKVNKDDKYDMNKIEYIKYIFEDYGTVDLNYTVYDRGTGFVDKAYDGVLRIIVE